MNTMQKFFLGGARILLGAIFFWAFIDKVFGLGFSTDRGKAVLDGVSPTLGFLKFGTTGPFASFYQSIAGNIVVDWMYMLGLFFIGAALLFGIATRLASIAGTVFLLLIYLAVLPPAHHPVLDEHIIYIFVLGICASLHAGEYMGFGKKWNELVGKRASFLT